MNNILAKYPVCEQPTCALKQGCMNKPRLADLLIRALSKDGIVDCIPVQSRIVPQHTCVECAQRVIRGRKPLMTVAERDRIFADRPGASDRTHEQSSPARFPAV